MRNTLRYIPVACGLLACLSAAGFADAPGGKLEFQAMMCTGPVVPFQAAFRRQYDQLLFTGPSRLPMALGAEMRAIWPSGYGLAIGGSTASFKLHDGPLRLRTYGIMAGAMYQKKFGRSGRISVAASANGGPAWALATCEYQATDGSTAPGTVRETIVYRTLGASLRIDAQYRLAPWLAAGPYVSGSYMDCGDPLTGGLGNLGGFTAGLSIAIVH